MRLVEQSDVFVENLKTSTLHQIGIHETQLLDRNPRLLVLRIPPAGLTGDWANYTGFGAQFDGLSGFAQLDRPPRRRDGRDARRRCTWTPRPGRPARSRCWPRCTTAPRPGAASSSSSRRSRTCSTSSATRSSRCSSAASRRAPATAIPNRRRRASTRAAGEERWLAITVRDDDEWAALARVIGREDLLTDSRFARPCRPLRAPRRARPCHHRVDRPARTSWPRSTRCRQQV